MSHKIEPFNRLIDIMAILRSPGGCNWDRKQTHVSLLPYLIEETYEVVEAVESGDPQHLREELGDLLIQIIFHARIAEEAGHFNINDAINDINEKLINRHPHVFGEKKDLKPQEVRDQWEKIKIDSGEKKSVINGIPKSAPALVKAFRFGEKAGGVGFDWNNPSEVLEKVKEEVGEIEVEMNSGDVEKLEHEIGDALFAISSLARKMDINPEQALNKTLEKFQKRFNHIEAKVAESGKSFGAFTLEELEAWWQEAKEE
ncbi:MAG: nucleoside triphosphate pyrophosphohydrolase [candidate division Zixibacteria bacterium HGW-Zixibacteria-1]|nr:MAG: nucleoside triphosphate pyrophosphohydrolase [candidate division Zixibacteria bacterium HGW-Zixibacteria-1]